jgi:hypothetical protein
MLSSAWRCDVLATLFAFGLIQGCSPSTDDGKDTSDTSAPDTQETADSNAETGETGETADTTETGETGETADTTETGETGDTGDTGDTGVPACPPDLAGVCGTIRGTTPEVVYGVGLYPPGADLPAALHLEDPGRTGRVLPLDYFIGADAFPKLFPPEGPYDALLVIDTDGDGFVNIAWDEFYAYEGNPVILDGTNLVTGVDFTIE